MLTICNTSPLLYLHLTDRLELLQTLYNEIVIPPAVQTKLEVGGSQGIEIPNPDRISWIRVVPVQSQTLIPVVTDLGAGEAEVIGLALEHPGSRIIVDDQLGRRVAAINHIKFTGTSGVVLKAKQTGTINAVKPIIKALRAAGLWMDNDLENLILSQAGE